jgi:hypothetical protein
VPLDGAWPQITSQIYSSSRLPYVLHRHCFLYLQLSTIYSQLTFSMDDLIAQFSSRCNRYEGLNVGNYVPSIESYRLTNVVQLIFFIYVDPFELIAMKSIYRSIFSAVTFSGISDWNESHITPLPCTLVHRGSLMDIFRLSATVISKLWKLIQ